MEKLYKLILDSAFEVHSLLGPGLFENTYKQCLSHELKLRDVKVDVEKRLPVFYKGIKLDCGYRIDMLVEKQIVIELKSVDKLTALHMSQLLSYMRLSNKKLGLLINFNTRFLKDGIKRVVL
ncbi:GxxExxY protein [Clostridium sp. 'deep sea']|uniref:GxxExxY protein n=1 Tax=Clostridium sp. 'deep sea' TaxID=2779445 RepID=UPI0018965D79|nr:GxxExxY protein [Clostridium sp. 'deep sea']QOR35371.1 GxxExxY protein [Clostridium sp. 'deep sea']